MKMETQPRGSTPVPDPTVLTTQQLIAAIAATRELLEARLDAMDTATMLNKQATDQIPRMIDEKVCQLRKLTDEKFSSIDIQFRERDTRADKIAELGQKALEAALSAAKEAVGKTEIAFTKQIDATAEQIQAEKRATDGKFEDVKARLGTLEASINTRAVVTTEGRGQINWMVGLFIIGGLSLTSVVVSVIAMLMRSPLTH